MHVGVLIDDATCWKGEGVSDLVLDGFSYGRVAGTAPTNSDTRIKWLKRQRIDHLSTAFRPQPWEQVISVLRTMGHPDSARRVAMEKQWQMLRVARAQFPNRGAHWSYASRCIGLIFKWLYGALVGFGYKPGRLLLVMVNVWLVFGLAFWWASSPYTSPIFPSSSLFVAAKEADRSCATPTTTDIGRCGPASAFQPVLYSADALLPPDLGYQSNFKPANIGLGWMVAAETFFGWLGIALLIAALTNLIKKD